MNDLRDMLDKIGRDIAKQKVDANPYTNYLQKATAKAIIDGKCDLYTYLNRIDKYLFEYAVQEYQNQARYYYQQPIFY